MTYSSKGSGRGMKVRSVIAGKVSIVGATSERRTSESCNPQRLPSFSLVNY